MPTGIGTERPQGPGLPMSQDRRARAPHVSRQEARLAVDCCCPNVLLWLGMAKDMAKYIKKMQCLSET